MLRTYKWSLSLRCPLQNTAFTSILPNTRHMSCPSHSYWFDQPGNIWCAVQIRELLLMLPLVPPSHLFPLQHNIFISTLLSNTLGLRRLRRFKLIWEWYKAKLPSRKIFEAYLSFWNDLCFQVRNLFVSFSARNVNSKSDFKCRNGRTRELLCTDTTRAGMKLLIPYPPNTLTETAPERS